jgi:regulatory protein
LRARSTVEVKNYLRRLGVHSSVVEPMLEKLRRLNYINDEAFARNWALSRSQHQGYGPRKIDQELRKKGVVDEIIRAVVEEIFAQENEESRARRILEKRFAGEMLQEPRMLHRAVGFLQRRGYSAKVISTLLHYSIDDNC